MVNFPRISLPGLKSAAWVLAVRAPRHTGRAVDRAANIQASRKPRGDLGDFFCLD